MARAAYLGVRRNARPRFLGVDPAGTAIAIRVHMKSNRIDFISAYCDRWCERCAFTMRCSTYALHVATTMCDGDLKEALELAAGRARSSEPDDEPQPEWRGEPLDVQVTRPELERTARLDDARRERIEQVPLTTVATGVSRLVVDWLGAHRDHVHRHATPELANALDIVSWDVYLIGAKIHRALDGRDQVVHGENFDRHPVQNDWNGSAKVALISIGRSAAAWDIIAAVTGNTEAARLAEETRSLGRHVERTFPNAWKFVRPGFDSTPASGKARRGTR